MAEPIITPPFDDLSPLPRRRLAGMRAAADELFAVLEILTREGRHPVRDVLAVSRDAYTRWEHYPPDNVEDARTGCAWYYHAHDPSALRPWQEHGHFHCFAHTKQMAKTARPIALPADPDFDEGGLVHLVAISFDTSGAPTRLFTTNRWASNEWLYPARDVVPLIERFEIKRKRRFALTSRWLSAALRLLHPQIAWLLHERDRVLGEQRKIDPQGFSEDQSIDVTSVVAFDLDAHLAALIL